jgi:hypothetical protein
MFKGRWIISAALFLLMQFHQQPGCVKSRDLTHFQPYEVSCEDVSLRIETRAQLWKCTAVASGIAIAAPVLVVGTIMLSIPAMHPA